VQETFPPGIVVLVSTLSPMQSALIVSLSVLIARARPNLPEANETHWLTFLPTQNYPPAGLDR
jgi:hypothetical protein